MEEFDELIDYCIEHNLPNWPTAKREKIKKSIFKMLESDEPLKKDGVSDQGLRYGSEFRPEDIVVAVLANLIAKILIDGFNSYKTNLKIYYKIAVEIPLRCATGDLLGLGGQIFKSAAEWLEKKSEEIRKG